MRNSLWFLLIVVLAAVGCQSTMPKLTESAVDKELAGSKPKPPLPGNVVSDEEMRPGYKQESTVSQE